MPYYGVLDQITGRLSNLRSTDAPGAGDVPLAQMPSDFGPWTYDAVNHLAVTSAALAEADDQANASALLVASGPLYRVLRSIASALVSEINLLRDRLTAQDSVVAAATSLADLKTRWAALASAQPMPDRTLAQAKAAIQAAAQSSATD